MKTFLMALSIASSLLVTRPQAQSPDRADLLKQERAAGIAEATPPQRTTIERGMNVLQKAREGFERLMGDENGWHYSSGDFPAGAGIRPGEADTTSSACGDRARIPRSRRRNKSRDIGSR